MANAETTTSAPVQGATKPARRPAIGFLAPMAIFLAMAVMFAYGLTRNPRELPSMLIDKPVPEFALPPVEGRTLGLSTADLKGEVSLLNVFASWCVECRREHPVFMRLRREKIVPLHGLNYKDRPEDVSQWLADLGDPYTRTGADLNGRVGIELGVYGVPETFVVDANGIVVHKHIGAVDEEVFETIILPLIKKLQDQS